MKHKNNDCPICNTEMTIKKTSGLDSVESQAHYYFMYCKSCGYGPVQTYHSVNEAIESWNDDMMIPVPDSIPEHTATF